MRINIGEPIRSQKNTIFGHSGGSRNPVLLYVTPVKTGIQRVSFNVHLLIFWLSTHNSWLYLKPQNCFPNNDNKESLTPYVWCHSGENRNPVGFIQRSSSNLLIFWLSTLDSRLYLKPQNCFPNNTNKESLTPYVWSFKINPSAFSAFSAVKVFSAIRKPWPPILWHIDKTS